MDTPDLTREDLAHLEWARRLARRGWGRVHPNPMVGCVLVNDGRVVGEGYHADFGGPHAEIVALEDAKSRAEGATAYVSLEPCDHQGKTPPCSVALADAGVIRVVYGVAEPGVEEGGGAQTLRDRGVAVLGPVWGPAEGRAENPAFFHTRTEATPYVALKLAVTLDGKISAGPGKRSRITGTDGDREVHRLRSGFDGVLIGAGTARTDDPRLTVRLVPPPSTPLRRLVLDPSAGLASNAALFADTEEAPLHVFVRRDAGEEQMERLEALGAHVHPVPGTASRLELDAVLGVCWELGIQRIMCEGGAELAESLLSEKRVHRLYLFVAPATFGPAGVPAFGDAEGLVWDDFSPAFDPELHGRDSLLVFDRQDD